MGARRQLHEQQVLQTNAAAAVVVQRCVAENEFSFTNKQTINNESSHAVSGLIAVTRNDHLAHSLIPFVHTSEHLIICAELFPSQTKTKTKTNTITLPTQWMDRPSGVICW